MQDINFIKVTYLTSNSLVSATQLGTQVHNIKFWSSRKLQKVLPNFGYDVNDTRH